MTTVELIERINKKDREAAKAKARLEELLKECDQDEYDAIIVFVETGDATDYRNYLKSHNKWCGGAAWSKAREYHDAVNCLDKYQKQLAIQEAKEKTLADMPEVLKEFRDNLVDRWDKYDAWKQEQIKKEYRDDSIEYRELSRSLREKWGSEWYDFMSWPQSYIHEQNVKSAESLVLNLINRTVEIAGKITDCSYLYLDQDNLGYCIVNGLVIGEKGKAKVESIGAGGYNIQRYHIRVLVKEVK